MAAQFGELVILRDPQPHDRHALRRRDDDILALVADAGEQVVGAAVGPQRRGSPGRARPVEPDVAAISSIVRRRGQHEWHPAVGKLAMTVYYHWILHALTTE